MGIVVFLTDQHGNSMPMGWKAGKIERRAHSVHQAELLAGIAAQEKSEFLQQLFTEMGFPLEKAVLLKIDNDAVVRQLHNCSTAYKDQRFVYLLGDLRQEMNEGRLKVEHVPGEINYADTLTKPMDTKFLQDAMMRGTLITS
jgi:hypothetical protein